MRTERFGGFITSRVHISCRSTSPSATELRTRYWLSLKSKSASATATSLARRRTIAGLDGAPLGGDTVIMVP